MSLLLVAALTVLSAAEPAADVRRPLSAGASVNWTRLLVEVRAVGDDALQKLDSKPIEQRAIHAVDQRIGEDCAGVPLRADVRLGDVRERIRTDAMNAWRIIESRYHAAGQVEVVGTIELLPLFSPWQHQRSLAAPVVDHPGATGVLIDARGLGAGPVVAPRVLGPEGEVLYDGTVWKDVAWQRAPVVWVGDPAHPAAAAAGTEPAIFVAVGAALGEVQLSAADAARFKAEVVPTRALGDGAVVIVVDP